MPYFCRNIRREGYLGRPAAQFSHKTTVIYNQTIDDNGIYGVEEYRSGSAALNPALAGSSTNLVCSFLKKYNDRLGREQFEKSRLSASKSWLTPVF